MAAEDQAVVVGVVAEMVLGEEVTDVTGVLVEPETAQAGTIGRPSTTTIGTTITTHPNMWNQNRWWSLQS